MADFLGETQREIAARMNELRPLVDEYARLEAAAAALAGVADTASQTRAPSSRRRGATRRATAAPRRRGATNGGGRRGRPKGSGTRGAEALAIVTANPGIEIPKIAEQMGIKQNYLYRVLPGLAEDGKVRKEGRGWFPIADAA